jgi:hypothetical protein
MARSPWQDGCVCSRRPYSLVSSRLATLSYDLCSASAKPMIPAPPPPTAWGRWWTCLWSIARRYGMGPCTAHSSSASGGQTLSERQHEEGNRKACPMSLPVTLPNGFLPPGVHTASLLAIIERFGTATPRRQVLAGRLEEILRVTRATSPLQWAFLWGSFSTDALFPRDLDIFLLMQAGFDEAFRHLPPTQRDVFAHERAR